MKVLDNIPQDAAKFIKEEGIKIKLYQEEKYTRKKFLAVSDSYDFLQYQCVVRLVIQKRHKVGLRMLELLLYLYPMHYFTQKDYSITVRAISFSLKIMLAHGWFKIAQEGSGLRHHLYALTPKARHVVEEYYKFLSGEKEIPEFIQKNFSQGDNLDDKRNILLQKFMNEIAENPKTRLFL